MPIELTKDELEIITEGLNSRDVCLYEDPEKVEILLDKLRRYKARCIAEAPLLPYGESLCP